MTPLQSENERTGKYVFFMASCAAGAAGLCADSTYHWLRYGTWARITLADIITSPRVDWIGLQSAIHWLWTFPLWLALLLAAFIAVFALDRNP
jgi:hypothetical protein